MDGLTLDQLRLLDTVVREGSFSGAARQLRRAQSAVSSGIANLEAQLDTKLFVRGRREARLTPEGSRLLAQAQRVLHEVDGVRALAEALAGGLEPRVALAVDMLFDTNALCALCRSFSVRFPTVDLRLDTDTLSAVKERVVSGQASMGVIAAPALDARLVVRAMPSVRLVPVASAGHPLAKVKGPIGDALLREHVQMVLTERGPSQVPDQAVASGRTWRIADLMTKHTLLRAGLGWGNLPEHLAKGDLAKGRLRILKLTSLSPDAGLVPLYAAHLAGQSLGPAHRWLLDELAPDGEAPSSKRLTAAR